MDGFEYVLKYSAKVDPRDLVREDRHRSVTEIQRANIVQPEDVVDVAMGYKDGVEPLYLRPQCLLAKIDRGVDEDLGIAVFDQDRNAQPLITRVFRQARLAVACDGWDAGGSSGTEKG
jgi:hypothetical protein